MLRKSIEFWQRIDVLVSSDQSQSRYGLETRPASLFYLFVRVYTEHGEDNEFLV